jgi:hypothetical protein
MSSNVADALQQHLHGMPAPFLFVGAGLSRRYANGDSWEALLRRFAEATRYPFEYYKTSAGGDYPAMASHIASEFHEVWWRDGEYSESRQRWAKEIVDKESPLKVEVCNTLAELSSNLPTTGQLADELTLLRSAVVDGVITTNYDTLLETIYPQFKVFVGQEELLFANPQGVAEIYKIHGSVTVPDSLTLTSSDYREFQDRSAYLAAKLLTIFVEHPVIFLGYSITDPNIRSILRSISNCLTQRNIHELRDRLIFVQWQADVSPSIDSSLIVVDDFQLPITRVTVSAFQDVFGVLASLKRAFPAQLLRRLKEQVYELVLSDDPGHQLFVANIEDDTSLADIDVVFGVGVQAQMGKQGYKGLDRWDLMWDIVDGAGGLAPEEVVRSALPEILRFNGNVPVFKYLRGMGALDDAGNVQESSLVSDKVIQMAAKIRGGLPASAHHQRKAPAFLKNIDSFKQLEQEYGIDGVVNYATLLPPEKVDPGDLLSFLRNHRSAIDNSWIKTQYQKLICFYDWLVYGLQLGGDATGQAPCG